AMAPHRAVDCPESLGADAHRRLALRTGPGAAGGAAGGLEAVASAGCAAAGEVAGGQRGPQAAERRAAAPQVPGEAAGERPAGDGLAELQRLQLRQVLGVG
ncbi:unnamed protein product, partial [Prorocentrum cordatum]